MSLSVVQVSSKQVADSVINQTFSFTVTPGNAILVAVIHYKSAGANAPLIEVSDNVDGKYTLDGRAQTTDGSATTNGQGIVYLFRLPKATGTTRTINIAPNIGNGYFVSCAIEVSGSPLVKDINSNFSQTSASTSITSDTASVSSIADELLVGVCTILASQASITPQVTSPTWTTAIQELNFSLHTVGEVDYKIVSSIGNYVANWTAASAALNAGLLVSYVAGSSSSGEHSAVF